MRERAEELGGTLTVETLPEGGTRVLSRLPLSQSRGSHKDEPARVIGARSAHPGPPGRRPRLFRHGLKAMLASISEYEVVGEAATGEEAVEKAANAQPQIVLMDIQMPQMNGIEATRRIVEANPRTRVVMLTMFGDDDSVFAAMRAGARGYVLKGADEKEVLKVMGAVAGGGPLRAGDRRALDELLLHPHQGSPSFGGFPGAHLPRSGGLRSHRPRSLQYRDSEAAVREPQDGAQPHLQHLHQAASGRPGAGYSARPRSRAGPGGAS